MFSPLFGWQPDEDPTLPGVVTDVSYMEPTSRGLRAAPTLEDLGDITTALAATCVGAHMGGPLNVAMVAAAANGKIYRKSGATWVDATGNVSLTTAAGLAPWRFTTFDERIFAVQSNNPSLIGNGLATFAVVTSAPKASVVCSVRDFVMVASVNDGSYIHGDAWWCCAIGDPTDWTPDISTQATRDRLQETPGQIVALHEYLGSVIAFKNDSMYRLDYSNDAFVFRSSLVSKDIGAISHESVVAAEGVLFWWDRRGCWMYDGTRPVRVPGAPVDWFISQNISSGPFIGQYDYRKRIIRWYLRTAFVAAHTNTVLLFHPESGRWGRSDHASNWATLSLLGGSPVFPIAAVFGADHKLKTYTGPAGNASLTTGDIGTIAAPAMLGGTRPKWLTSPTSATATHYYRDDPGATLATGVAQPMAMGKFDFTHSARFHRLKIATTGACEINGLWHEIKGDGKR